MQEKHRQEKAAQELVEKVQEETDQLVSAATDGGSKGDGDGKGDVADNGNDGVINDEDVPMPLPLPVRCPPLHCGFVCLNECTLCTS